MRHLGLAAALLLAGSVPAWAQKAGAAPAAKEAASSGPISLTDLKVQFFLEKSGRLSDNIAGAKKTFHNTVLGEGDAGEPADALLVTLVFQGDRNSRGSDKLARDLAQVKVTQQAKTGTRMLLNRVYGGFVFGDTGLSHKAFLVDNATCAPLEIEAKIGKTRKLVKIDFSCDLPR